MRPVLRPLIPPNAARGVIADIVSEMREAGPIDTVKLIRAFAELRPVTRVPRLPRPRIRRSALLIADLATSMTPFRRDASFVYGLLVGLLDEDRVDFRTVLGNPQVILSERPLLETGRLVLALTDLGVGSVDLLQQDKIATNWLRFAAMVADAGADLVVLNPYPPARWPLECRRELRILHLDRRTQRSRRDRLA